MNYSRHYIQFNDLVFDEAEMVSGDPSSVGFKSQSEAYTFTHGAYSPQKLETVLASAGAVSLSLTFRMKKLPCEARPFYRRFAVSELTKSGKLWAVQDNTIIWAYAHINAFSEQVNVKRDTLEIDIDFELPEGVWHKAHKQKTFLVPFDKCEFMECYGYHEVETCVNCCKCEKPIGTCVCCDCDNITKDMALCYHTGDLQSFYECESKYKVVYSCETGERFFFKDYYSTDHIGQKICGEFGVVSGVLYSDTELLADLSIRLHGQFKDPYIEINGNGNVIKGTFDGTLIIDPDGTLSTFDCAKCEILPVDSWVVPSGMDYGWKVKPGNNSVVIETGECDGSVCAYFDVDALTI